LGFTGADAGCRLGGVASVPKMPRITPMRRYVPLLIAGSAFIAAACRDAIAPTRSTTAKDLPTLTAFKGGFHSFAEIANDEAESNAKVLTSSCGPAAVARTLASLRSTIPP